MGRLEVRDVVNIMIPNRTGIAIAIRNDREVTIMVRVGVEHRVIITVGRFEGKDRITIMITITIMVKIERKATVTVLVGVEHKVTITVGGFEGKDAIRITIRITIAISITIRIRRTVTRLQIMIMTMITITIATTIMIAITNTIMITFTLNIDHAVFMVGLIGGWLEGVGIDIQRV